MVQPSHPHVIRITHLRDCLGIAYQHVVNTDEPVIVQRYKRQQVVLGVKAEACRRKSASRQNSASPSDTWIQTSCSSRGRRSQTEITHLHFHVENARDLPAKEGTTNAVIGVVLGLWQEAA